MKTQSIILAAFLALLIIVPPANGQEVSDEFKDGFYGRFNYAAFRLVALAEDLPEEVFSFKPNEGAMTVEHVFMHLARYNYYYPSIALQTEMPADLPIDEFEQMTGKASVLKYLKNSLDHVREVLKEMSPEELDAKVELYGDQTPAYNVFIQLQVHMGEHLGQLMAYSRMNDIVPPWSRKKAGS